MNKNLILDHFISKKTKNIDKTNQQYNLLVVCVLNKLNPASVKLLQYLYPGLKVDR